MELKQEWLLWVKVEDERWMFVIVLKGFQIHVWDCLRELKNLLM